MSKPGALVAIDPGATTGVAWIRRLMAEKKIGPAVMDSGGEDGDVAEYSVKNIRRGVPGAEVLCAGSIVDLLSAIEITHGLRMVIIEDFTLRMFSKNKDLLAPVRITAMIQSIAFEREVGVEAEWILQSASAKALFPKKRQEALGLWVKGRPHGRDALLHLVSRARRLR